MDVEVRPSRVGCCITVLFAGAKNSARRAVVETGARLIAVGTVAHSHLAGGITLATFDTLPGVYGVGAWIEVHAGCIPMVLAALRIERFAAFAAQLVAAIGVLGGCPPPTRQ